MKKKLGILGYPLEHSLSPVMHNRALEALNMDHISYEKIETDYYDLQKAIERIKDEYLGVNVTIPYKEKIMPWMDEISNDARAAGAVNTILIKDNRFIGTNTDGMGYVQSLIEQGISLDDKKVLILGAGGAARGLASSLIKAQVACVDIASRKRTKIKMLLDILEAIGSPSSKGMDLKNMMQKDLSTYDLIINATPVGMMPHQDECLSLPYETLNEKSILSDLVYRPLDTQFLKQGRKQGATVINGLGMLLHQGAASFEFWLGCKPPLDVMRQALLEATGEEV